LEYNHDFDAQITTAQTIAAKLHAEGLLDQGSGHTRTMGRKHPRSDRPLDNAAKRNSSLALLVDFHNLLRLNPSRHMWPSPNSTTDALGVGFTWHLDR
jgi:hypothetical protein